MIQLLVWRGCKRLTRPASASLDTPFSSSFKGAACSAGRTASRNASSTKASFLTAGSRTTSHSCVYASLIPRPLSSTSSFACRPSASSAGAEVSMHQSQRALHSASCQALHRIALSINLVSYCRSCRRLADFTGATAGPLDALINPQSQHHENLQYGHARIQPQGRSAHHTLTARKGSIRGRASQAHLGAGS